MYHSLFVLSLNYQSYAKLSFLGFFSTSQYQKPKASVTKQSDISVVVVSVFHLN